MLSAALEIPADWEEPEGLSELLDAVREANPKANIKRIRHAYYVAEQAHSGQTRSSGEPYITHPLAVAHILVELKVDEDSIVAALLHDVIEDCPGINAEMIEKTFGEDVLSIVEGVTKLKFKAPDGATPLQKRTTETTRAAESLRKMLLAMAKDFRVIIIKLADRLHNMMTLDSLPPDKRTRIASETLDVYAPLAARLGIWQMKWQLEDQSFKYLHPAEFQKVSELVAKSRKQRESELREAIVLVKERLHKRGVKAVEIQGRPKHLYSIFNKMVKQRVDFDEIYDLLALRIIVKEYSECYVALGVVHDLWMPIPGLFSDYIAKPKSNGYQSLHTKVVGPSGGPLEIQIRTQEMHEVAEHGVAAHWTYKEERTGKNEPAQFSRLRQQLFDWSSDSKLSSDFLRTLSTDLFSEQVFVFTPKGDVIDLPMGSTPVDFAFRVHTQLGLTLVGAKVNGQMVTLHTPLQNGDVVELITRANAQPSFDWLEFVRSSHARNKLRNHFRKISKFQDAQRGREFLEKELKTFGLDPKPYLGDDKVGEILTHFHGVENAVDLFAKVGTGLVSAQSVVMRLRGAMPELKPVDQIQISPSRQGKLVVSTHGMEGILVRRAKCCDPIPGDEVVGYVTRGRGIMVHRRICPNALAYYNQEPDRLLPLDWPGDGSQHSVELQIITVNRQGLLMDISTIFGEAKTNVSAARIRTLPNQTAEINVTIDVADTVQLSQVMNKISNFSDVISILRMFGRTAGK
jgi:guanosine-3',5'-bis(diphosphate) 3'-pyrophosphohydrolase